MRVRDGMMGTGRVNTHTGEMTFGDATESSFCIKHKLLIQLKKIISVFS